MAERTRNQFIYSERSWTDPSDKPDLDRVNIRPRQPYDVLEYSLFRIFPTSPNQDWLSLISKISKRNSK